MNGTVKWFNDEKGYGFITKDDGGDVFVHYSSIEMAGRRSLQEGDRVVFDVTSSSKGERAEKVRILS